MDRKLKLHDSDNIKGGTYDPSTGRLTIHFKGEAVGAFHDVPQHKIDKLESHDSHGKYFNEHIQPHHEYSRVR